MSVQPLISACLNGASAACLLLGRVQIHRERERAHRNLMLTAALLSTLFLVNYVIYHAVHGRTTYAGEGGARTLYLAILITHTVLAVLLVPLAARTLFLGWRGRRAAHRRLARLTFPVWLYVSVTGVTIYLMLYA